MKTRHLITPILLFGITVCSCKKNDSDNSSTRKNMLIAKWKYTHFAWDSNNNKLPDDSFHAVPDSISYYYDIKSNGQVDIADNGQLTTVP